MIIYKTTNKINGKIYIGKDSKNNSNYLGSGVILQNAIKKYGKENFVKEIIEECKNEQHLDEREIYWINYFSAVDSEKFYNLADGGCGVSSRMMYDYWKNHPERKMELSEKMSGENNPFYGKTHTEENKQLFADNARKLHTGKKRSEETKRRIKEGVKNSDHAEIMKSPEMSKRISEATKKGMDNPEVREKCAYWKGKKQPEEMVEKRNKKVSEALKGKPKSEEHKQALKEAWKRRKERKTEGK